MTASLPIKQQVTLAHVPITAPAMDRAAEAVAPIADPVGLRRFATPKMYLRAWSQTGRPVIPADKMMLLAISLVLASSHGAAGDGDDRQGNGARRGDAAHGAYDRQGTFNRSEGPHGDSADIDLAAWRLDGLTVGTPPPQRFLLAPMFPLGTAGVLFGPGGVGKSMVALHLCLAVARRAMMPAGVGWLERKVRRDALVDAANTDAAARVAAEWEAGQPARVLEAIESAGSTLSLGKPKGILATGAEISAEHMELLRTYRAGVEALLTARAAANAPRLIA